MTATTEKDVTSATMGLDVTAQGAANDWHSWQVSHWNERLLEHFFKLDDPATPVVVLLVTAEELARVTGDANAAPDEVREAFLSAVLSRIRRSRNLLEDASDYEQWPRPPFDDQIPPFLAHLIFTCIAASESSDDLADEQSFIVRLRDLTRDQLPDNSLQLLPVLWENLAKWLSDSTNPEHYRQLELPSPGGFTRIGYTVKLAFPDRRDQRLLSELLDAAGLVGHEPPVGKVLSLVAAARPQFRASFLSAADEFRDQFEASTNRAAPRLWGHRFWAAVREAAARGRGAEEASDLRGWPQLLCEEEDDRLVPFVVVDQSLGSGTAVAIELPFAYGPWRFALVKQGASAADAESLDAMTRAVLQSELRLPRLSPRIREGVLPFGESPHGLLELSSQENLEAASVALVRRDLVDDLMRIYGGPSTKVRPSAYPDWKQVHDVQLTTRPSEELESTALRRTWTLHDSLLPMSIRLVGGVRADDGWLGFAELLPRVATPNASEVWLEGRDQLRVALERDGNGAWKLPRRDLSGDVGIVVRRDDDTSQRRSVLFHTTPADEQYRGPNEPTAWISEALGGTTTLEAHVPFDGTISGIDATAFAERVLYLGPIVGEFVGDPEEAAWRVKRFAGRLLGSRCRLDLASKPPTARNSRGSSRSRWRKLLLHSTADPADPGFEAARRAVRRDILADLAKVDLPERDQSFDAANAARPHDALNRLVPIFAGRSSARTGLSWRDWSELLQRLLGVEAARVDAITRAWCETSLLDVASSARWWHRCVFARPPALVAFHVGAAIGATLTGLTLPTTKSLVRGFADAEDVLVEERFSTSPFVPPTLAFRAPSVERLQALSSRTGVPLRWLNLDFERYADVRRHDGRTPAPLNYESRHRWQRWSLLDGASSETVTLDHCMRPDRPDFWLVTAAPNSVWSFDLNVARSWAAAFAGEMPIEPIDHTDLIVRHAYAPLPLARMLSVLGATLPGPDPSRGWEYRYSSSSLALRDRTLETVRRIFDPAVAAAATQQSESYV